VRPPGARPARRQRRARPAVRVPAEVDDVRLRGTKRTSKAFRQQASITVTIKRESRRESKLENSDPRSPLAFFSAEAGCCCRALAISSSARARRRARRFLLGEDEAHIALRR
jgi:hypothetical protein